MRARGEGPIRGIGVVVLRGSGEREREREEEGERAQERRAQACSKEAICGIGDSPRVRSFWAFGAALAHVAGTGKVASGTRVERESVRARQGGGIYFQVANMGELNTF